MAQITDGYVPALIGALTLCAVKLGDIYVARYGKTIDRDLSRESQLSLRLTQVEARFDAQEKRCQERIDALEAEVEEWKAKWYALSDRAYRLEHDSNHAAVQDLTEKGQSNGS